MRLKYIFSITVEKRISAFWAWVHRWQFDWHVGLYLSSSDDSESNLIIDASSVNNPDNTPVASSSNEVSQIRRENGVQRETNGNITQENKGTTKKRVKSLDAFRGLSITIMIFVNYGGGGYW